jgi:hypothetical protein
MYKVTGGNKLRMITGKCQNLVSKSTGLYTKRSTGMSNTVRTTTNIQNTCNMEELIQELEDAQDQLKIVGEEREMNPKQVD